MIEVNPIPVIFEQGDTFSVTFTGDDFNVDMSGLHPPGDYNGEYVITPTDETQTLATLNKRLAQNIIINPIPSNYGKITWNGTVITVS